MSQGLRRAVFLDRDGTIIEDAHYLASPEGVKLLPGAGEAIHRLNQAGLQVVVISNQSGLARGYFTEDALEAIHRELDRQLAGFGARIDAYYYCPHHVEGTVPELSVACACRKPAPGMLFQAGKEMGLDLKASFMIGDRLKDVACAHRAGSQGILVSTGQDDGEPTSPEETPDFVASGLDEAADWIMARLEDKVI